MQPNKMDGDNSFYISLLEVHDVVKKVYEDIMEGRVFGELSPSQHIAMAFYAAFHEEIEKLLKWGLDFLEKLKLKVIHYTADHAVAGVNQILASINLYIDEFAPSHLRI